ncbi:MAG: non-canonical purine NTP pyrophosphatase, RdgB/HAM1 family [Desulfuromonadaceae bacterium GWB2_53_15]|nr:MAG: non-canonical purine NTP pyrophosphatase, RdgB/HAM1 family [Desulfuromonadales bacterium GWD2_54_10]OHB32789.1 MAG: non-canonical purine NTP pyrophosphatase, RdgB/HAM1 family [Desulfuromonadaceae bacterium GWB2_53_15]
MTSLVVATRNRGKLKEIQAFLEGLVANVYCSSDFENFTDTVEDGATFELNALKKAREAMRFTGLPALADDSGLVVDALDGRPGVYSARFAGDAADDVANNLRLLEELESVPASSRQCSFVCSMAFVTPEGCEQTFSGKIEGRILGEERGNGGFGYDPLFLVDGFDRTMAELSTEEKNQISHRGQALRQFREYLETH